MIMRRNILKITGIVLIVIGLVLLILPVVSEFYLKNYSDRLNHYTDELDQRDLKDNLSSDATYDFDLVDFISVSGTFVEIRKSKINYNQIIGQIVIPSLKTNLTLFNGINSANLYAGVSTVKPKQVMGERNYAIAGHSTSRPGVLLTELLKIKVGAIVRITDKEMIYEYQIYETKVVPDTAVHLITDKIAEEKGGPIISLMSCFHYYNPDKRFFAFGELIDVYPYSKTLMEKAEE